MDLDWEYPGIPVLGGRPSDKPGLAAVVREWRSAIRASGKPFIISIDTPQVPAKLSAIAPTMLLFRGLAVSGCAHGLDLPATYCNVRPALLPQFCYGTGAADDPCSAYDFPNIWPHVDFISPMTYGWVWRQCWPGVNVCMQTMAAPAGGMFA